MTNQEAPERRLLDRRDWPPVVIDRDGDRWVWNDAESGYQLHLRRDHAPSGGAWQPSEVEAEYGPLSLPGFSFWTTEPVKPVLPPALIDCDGDRWELDAGGRTYTFERDDDPFAAIAPHELIRRYGSLRTPDGAAWEPAP